MEKGIVIGLLVSLVIVISLGLFFNFSNKNFYLGQISSSLIEFENLTSEIENLKKEISSLKEELEKERKEKIKENALLFQQNFKEEKAKIENPKGTVICQKKENDIPKQRVIFNEINWMGDEQSPTNEWFEIKNVSQKEIDLSGWQILNKNKKIKIIFEEGVKILPNEILLLQRGDDFSGAIKNSDEALFLFDKNCNLEDEVFATSFWPAGDNFSKRTMERKKDLSWQTSYNVGGSPGSENTKGFIENEDKTEEKELFEEPKISLSFPKEIFTNELFDVTLNISDIEKDIYDVKISVLKISNEPENKKTLSEISLDGEEWYDSFRFLLRVFENSSFVGNFKLRISKNVEDFKGEAEIVAKIRNSESKKVVSEFKDKVIIKGKKELIQNTSNVPFKESSQNQQQPPQSPNPSLANLLLNEFFENWSEKDGKLLPDNWFWNGSLSRISQSTDSFVGNYSVELALTTKETKFLYQTGIKMDSQKIYYAAAWVKGKGIVKIGIKYPASSYVYYGEEIVLDTQEWTTIEVSRKPSNSGEDGGIKISVRYDDSKNIPSGSKIIIGAAWLGEVPPPSNLSQ